MWSFRLADVKSYMKEHGIDGKEDTNFHDMEANKLLQLARALEKICINSTEYKGRLQRKIKNKKCIGVMEHDRLDKYILRSIHETSFH